MPITKVPDTPPLSGDDPGTQIPGRWAMTIHSEHSALVFERSYNLASPSRRGLSGANQQAPFASGCGVYLCVWAYKYLFDGWGPDQWQAPMDVDGRKQPGFSPRR